MQALVDELRGKTATVSERGAAGDDNQLPGTGSAASFLYGSASTA